MDLSVTLADDCRDAFEAHRTSSKVITVNLSQNLFGRLQGRSIRLRVRTHACHHAPCREAFLEKMALACNGGGAGQNSSLNRAATLAEAQGSLSTQTSSTKSRGCTPRALATFRRVSIVAAFSPRS